MTEISVPWPRQPLTEQQWRGAVEALAEAAEAQVGRRPSLQDQAQLAMWFAGLLWPALSPELVAGSCRASLLLGAPGVVLSSAPADQVQEIAERLDRIWQQAQHDPSAAVATVAPPLLDLPPTAPRRTGRPAKAQEPAPAPPEPAAPDPEPDPEPEAPPAAPAPEPIPADWFTAADLAQLLEVSETTLSRWRKAGRCGEQGTDWRKCGRQFYFSPDAAEQLMQQQAA
jgi:hypothetical protein